MSPLSLIDYSIIAAFFVIILLVGVVMSRQAAKSLEHYFLGGRNLPWYMLGISGMSGWFDLTGTMIITSFLYMLGPRGLYIEFRGGAVLVLAFLLTYTGKWHRRSGCMTGAEWMTYRFGTGPSGELLRLACAVMGIITTVGMLAYLVRGATLFMGMIFPVNPVLLTIGLLGLASLYTVLAGFYGVVLTDMVQGVIMIVGCIIISIIAWSQNAVPDSATLNAIAHKVTGNPDWTASLLTFHVDMPHGYEAYNSLFMAAMFYLFRNILGGMSSGGESRFFASKNSREASMQCLLQAVTVMFRWPLMISFAILGIVYVSEAIPDNSKIATVTQIIRQENPTITPANWHTYTSTIAHHPELSSPELVNKLQNVLGSNWQSSLLLVGSSGTVNPEVILPAVLLNGLPVGLRAVMIVSLLAALMGALTGTVNGASALFVRDIYQNFIRPKSSNKELIRIAYASSTLIVLASFLLGLAASSINDIWSWIIMGLTAGGLGPGLLRLYWWRTNAWGMAAGIFVGGLAATAQRFFDPHMSEWMQFTVMTLTSVIVTVLCSLLTKATPDHVTRYFYRTTRPFGFWGHFTKELSIEEQHHWAKEHRNDLIAAAIALVWQVCLFLLPMQFLTRNWAGFGTTAPIFAVASIGLYIFWWKNLPSADESIPNFESSPESTSKPTNETIPASS
ncbi:MAG: hypothetical protein B9S32_09985 [Verrucomicrobia bacterium Tous-C9LFEB]|nr:MAG: hypothetical protein B9S32_09985 [Verrucomicrobia bacterium Tous-C9LFEB]